jgi:hypothetical protein
MNFEHDTETAAMLHKRVSERAYQIWEEHGRPHGMEHQNWIQAEREIEGQQTAEVADEFIYTSAV